MYQHALSLTKFSLQASDKISPMIGVFTNLYGYLTASLRSKHRIKNKYEYG